MNKITIMIITLILCGCTKIKFFPNEIGVYGVGEEQNLSMIIDLMKDSKEPNVASAILFWKSKTYSNNSNRKISWSYGVSTQGKTCKQAVKSSLESCKQHLDIYHIGSIPNKDEPYYGCHILAIKCPDLENELNIYNVLEW
ncbi:MAG: hypothetical protein ACK5L8_02490 [Marinicella pacifica]